MFNIKNFNLLKEHDAHIGSFHVDGTSIKDKQKPMAKLESISGNYNEIPLMKFKKELLLEIGEKLIDPLVVFDKGKQKSDPYNSKLAKFINEFSSEITERSY